MVTTYAAEGHFAAAHPAIHIREIGIADIRDALAQGWADFKAKRGDLLFVGLIYPLVGLAACLVALNQSLVPLVFPLAAGLTLFGPAVASGFYEMARRRERGEDTSWRHFFDVFRSPSIGSIAWLTLLLAALFVGWIAAAWALYDATFGPALPASAASFLRELFTTEHGWTLIIAGNLVGLGFAAVAMTISVFSFPMLVDRPVEAEVGMGTTVRAVASSANTMAVSVFSFPMVIGRPVGALVALETSIRAVARNAGTMAIWGLIVAVVLAIASIPLFVGLAVALPVLGYATWHLYTRVVAF